MSKSNILNVNLSKVDKFKKKSVIALGVLKRTVTDLHGINSEIIADQQVRKSKIVKMQSDYEELEAQRSENSAVIGKIEEFLGVSIIKTKK